MGANVDAAVAVVKSVASSKADAMTATGVVVATTQSGFIQAVGGVSAAAGICIAFWRGWEARRANNLKEREINESKTIKASKKEED